LRDLKPLDRETLEAFYLRGRSLKQMAREFETPVGTIKRRLHVARQRLKDVMESGGIAVMDHDANDETHIPDPKPRRAKRRELAGV